MSCLVNRVIFECSIFSCKILRWIGRLHLVVVYEQHIWGFTLPNSITSQPFELLANNVSPLIRPSFLQILGKGWPTIPGNATGAAKQIITTFWLQVLLVVPLHQRMDLGGLGDQDHGSFGADVWWIRKGKFYFQDLSPREYVALHNDLWRDWHF